MKEVEMYTGKEYDYITYYQWYNYTKLYHGEILQTACVSNLTFRMTLERLKKHNKIHYEILFMVVH